MKRLAYCIIALAVMSAAAGCCPCRFNKKNSKPLVGTTWHLVQLLGQDVNFDEGTFEVTFGLSGKLTGVGACNKFNAPFEATEKGALDIGMIISTRMYCPESETEQKLFRELDEATHYEITGPMLLILNNGEIRAIFSTPGSSEKRSK